MDSTQITEEVAEFLQGLKLVHRQPGSLVDMGLIIIEPNSEADVNAVINEISLTVPAQRVIYDNDGKDEDAVRAIVEALQGGLWPIVHIRKDIGSPLLNQLQHLANSNNLQILNFAGQELFEMTIPKNSRVIVVAGRTLIENTISYRHFYKLFGPILTI